MPTPLVKPATIVEPFAKNGTKNTIPVAASATPGRASLDTGFPALTMLPVQSGGVPPSGLDFNGIFNWITQHTSWLNAGGQYTFDATLAAFIGGYPVGMVLQSNDGLASYVNVTAGNSADFNTDLAQIGVTWLPYGGESVSPQSKLSIDISAGGVINVDRRDASKQTIFLTGLLTANVTIVLPPITKSWLIINGVTVGAFSVKVKSSTDSNSITLGQFQTNIIAFNGSSIVFAQTQAVTINPGDNSTLIANTAFVTAAIAAALVNTALTGNPTAPTQPPATNNTRIATTAYADASAAAIGAGSTPQYKNAAFTAGPTGDYWIDTSAGAFTMTLPDPPLGANCIRVQDITGTWSVKPITINPGTKTILGLAESLVDDVSGHIFEMWYDSSTSTWRLV